MVHRFGGCVVGGSDVSPTVTAEGVAADGDEPERDVVAEQATTTTASADIAIHRETTIRSMHPKAHIARSGASTQGPLSAQNNGREIGRSGAAYTATLAYFR